MVTLVDTSVLIAVERGILDLTSIGENGESAIAMSAVTASELLQGVHRSSRPDHRALREAFVESTLARVPVLSFELTAARIHARIWSDLASRGVTVDAHDLFIAATALAFGARVATRDRRSFSKIPGLSVVVW